MKATHLALLGTTLAALVIIGLQRSENQKLKTETTSLRSALHTPSMTPRAVGSSAGTTAEQTDPTGATGGSSDIYPTSLADILALPDPMQRIRALLAYVDSLDPSEIPAALDALRKGSPEWDPEAKMLAHMLLTRWAREDPEAAFASLDSMNFKQKNADPHIILASLASLDPKRAAAWLDNPDNQLVHFPWMGHILAGTVAKEWVRQDPDAALAWAATVPENQRLGAYTGVLGTLATTDPRRASTLAMNLEPGGARDHIAGEIAKTWARTAPDAALTWAQTLEGGERDKAIGQAIGTWAQTAPAETASFLEQLGTEESIDAHLPEVANNWSPQAPEDAAAWLATQPEGGGKNEAMGTVMWNWTTRDPEAAGVWLADQPAGPARDRGITGLAKAAFSFDPESALNWATEIGNEQMRDRSINHGIREWTKTNPDAAREWADTNEVPVP